MITLTYATYTAVIEENKHYNSNDSFPVLESSNHTGDRLFTNRPYFSLKIFNLSFKWYTYSISINFSLENLKRKEMWDKPDKKCAKIGV